MYVGRVASTPFAGKLFDQDVNWKIGADAFYSRLPALARENGLALREVYSEDDNLEAVFKYLVNQ